MNAESSGFITENCLFHPALNPVAEGCVNPRKKAIRVDHGADQTKQIARRSPVVLVADDSRLQREILKRSLSEWGYLVREADTGRAAMEICLVEDIDIILSDWMMPEMSGLEFCQAFRAMDRDSYSYFILLTSKDSKSEIAQGLEIGADDFLTKPVNSSELHARLRAGERVLEMQRELVRKNQAIAKNLGELSKLYQAMDRDLTDAKTFQHALLPPSPMSVTNGEVSVILQSSGHIGGDMVGYYFKDDRTLGIFGFDVSGHGVGAALMTARIASSLSVRDPVYNIAMRRTRGGTFRLRKPIEVARILNQRMIAETQTDLYLTLLLAEIDLKTGRVEIVQAGHPNPLIQSHDGGVEIFGQGGMPIGLFDEPDFTTERKSLSKGDRLLIYSDGFIETRNAFGAFLDEAGLAQMVERNPLTKGQEFLADLVWETQAFAGQGEVGDDLSAVMFEYEP